MKKLILQLLSRNSFLYRYRIHSGLYIAIFVLILSQTVHAQFSSGNLVAVQTSGSVSKAGSPVTLKEFTTNGTAGISFAIPATGATPLQMAAGPGGSEGFLTRSIDGTSLVLAGYATSTSYPVDITVSTSAAAPRAIFKVDALGNFSQAGSSSTGYNGNDIRGAITDGTNYWASGASNTGVDGINYYGPGAPAALAVNAKAYGMQIFNGQIYFSTQKTIVGVTPSFGIYALGNGFPTSGAITPSLIINTGSATPEDFSINPTGDICYIAINLNTPAGGIQKWTKSGAVWSLAYTLGTGASNIGAYGLVVDYAGANPVLYATTNESNTVGNRIIKITDTGAGSAATTLVAGTANTWFHGISFSPSCPLPLQPAPFTASTSNVNLGQNAVVYTVPNDPSVTYEWSYSGTGATIIGSGNSVTVNFSSTATNGTLRVKASNSCGTSNARSQDILINGAMRITEFMYSGANGEYIEFTNIGGTAVDMTGWSSDDATRTPGVHSLSGLGTVQPGESVILTETASSTFRSAWGLCSGIKIIGGYATDNLGRSDEINLYNGTTLIDRLTFNDQGTGTVKSPRTQNISAYVNASALGNNLANQWVLSASADPEGSFVSATGGDIGSPGKSTRATAIFNPCTVVNGAPNIIMDVTSTSNLLDGGVNTSPFSPYGLSGVISDPTDPASTLGLYFTINDAETTVDNLIVTVSSSNTSVVPVANINLTGSGASRNVKITPAAIGYANITLTVNDGTNTSSYIISYAASAASATPAFTNWYTGMSDASDAVPIDDNYFITGDDELNVLNVYSRSNSGLPLVSYDYSSSLNLPDPSKPEADLEAGTRSATNPNKMYWLGSMSNGKEPFPDKPNRNRIFATTISGTGSGTTFSPAGYYSNLRATLIAWGDAHGYNFTASAAAGVDSKLPNGFAAEGMVFGPDNSTLYIGLRAPLVPTVSRTKAVIAPIQNFEAWFNNGSPAGNPTFGSPIELDLGLRGIRDLIKLSNGTYIIVAGNPAGSPLTSVLFKWSGNAGDSPIMITSPADGLLNLEGAMEVREAGQLSLTKLEVITDGGDVDLYNDGGEAKGFGDLKLRKFRSDKLNSLNLALCQGVTASITANGPTTFCSGDSVRLTASPGNSYLWSNGATTQSIVVSATGRDSVKVADANGCAATSTAVSILVNSLPVPLIQASGNTTFCSGDSVILTATGGISYLWSNGATTQSIVVSATGRDSVKVVDANGCAATSTAVSILVNSLPVPLIQASGNTTFCSGDSVILTAIGGISYLWSNGATTQSVTIKSSSKDSVRVVDQNGCTATSASLTSIVKSLPVSTISSLGSTTILSGNFVTLQSSVQSGLTYQWKRNNIEIPDSTKPTINAKFAGIYTLELKNLNECKGLTNSLTIIVQHKPLVSNFSKTINEDASLTLGLSDFVTHFSDEDGDAISTIQLTRLPGKGYLSFNFIALQEGDILLASDFGSIKYVPYSDINGKDTIGWKGSDGTYLAPNPANIFITIVPVNDLPTVNITSPLSTSNLLAGNSILIKAVANDKEGPIKKVLFYADNILLGEDSKYPYEYNWQNVPAGLHKLYCKVIDNENATVTSSTVNINVQGCVAVGNIKREVYNNITGSSVSSLTSNTRYPNSPSYVKSLTSFESPANVAENYGSRIIGFICAPQTGDFTFYLAADEKAELWLGTSENPASKQLIASVTSAVNPRSYFEQSSQQSAPVKLVNGVRYFIMALHKESTLNDHLSVGWTYPNGVFQSVIPGKFLSPWTGGSVAREGEFEAQYEIPEDINVSPVPAIDFIDVTFSSKDGGITEISIKDALSNNVSQFQVQSNQGMNTLKLSLEGLASGIYFVNIVSGTNNFTKRIIISRE